MVRIRLRRTGMKKQASFRLVVADKESPRDGRYLEIVGYYNPRTHPSTLEVKEDRIYHWMSNGAQPSESVVKLFNSIGLIDRFERFKGGETVEALLVEAKGVMEKRVSDARAAAGKKAAAKPTAEKPASDGKVPKEVKTASEPAQGKEEKAAKPGKEEKPAEPVSGEAVEMATEMENAAPEPETEAETGEATSEETEQDKPPVESEAGMEEKPTDEKPD